MRMKKRLLTLGLAGIIFGSVFTTIVQAFEKKDERIYKVVYEENDYEKKGFFSFFSKKEELREDVKESRKNNKIRKMIPMTDSPYEVALAYENGSYEFVEGFENIDTAIEKCNTLDSSNNKSMNIVPVVIDKSGQVTYATQAVARIRKYVNGKISSGTSNVYPNSALSSAYTYVNHDYLSEVPLIGTSGQSARVLIGGYDGWMKYTDYGDYDNKTVDVVIWPLNQVKTPSYYIVENGMLKHWASTSLDGGSGSLLLVGTAPSYLEENVKYVSYDGNYFYKGSNLQDGIWQCTLDLREGKKGRAVNNGNPYYGYYQNLPFRTKSNYTAEEINKYIEENTKSTSKLRNLGEALKEAEEKYGVNALLTLSVAINESGWGNSKIAKDKNNLFGMGAVDSDPYNGAYTYPSTRESVLDFTKNFISNGYANPRDWRYWGGFVGNKNLGANVKYASDPFWGEKAANYAMGIDYYLANNDINKLKDENHYQLIRYTGVNTVMGSDGTPFYDISTSNASGANGTSVVGTITARASGNKVTIGGKSCLEIYADRNHSKYLSDFDGTYNWSKLGYISENNIEFLNSGKSNFAEEDFNLDGKIDMLDLSIISNVYNAKKGEAAYKDGYDLNDDEIIDIYDLVKVASKIK